MSTVRTFAAFGAIVTLATGCGSASAKRKPVLQQAMAAADWKVAVTARDMERLRNWRTAFVKAVDQAQAKGNGPSMKREGLLLDPDASIDGRPPPPGAYRCRKIRIGGDTGSAYTVFPHIACRISDEGEVMGFANEGGMQRAAGLIFKGDDKRSIFLGTMIVGDERRAIDYGRDDARDMAGAIERIGPQRWRLILPYPGFGGTLDLVELVPSAPAGGS